MVIAVSSTPNNEIPKLQNYIQKNKLSEWLHVLTTEKEVANNHGLFYGNLNTYYKIGVPRTVLIGRDGTVLYKKEGFAIEDMSEIAARVKKAVAKE